MFINGKWSIDQHLEQPTDHNGAFVRQVSEFRSWITPDGQAGPTGEGGFAAEPDRYHLFVALSCPWASRTLITRAIKGLDRIVSLSIVEPEIPEEGWQFGPLTHEGEHGFAGLTHLRQVYERADPSFTGRVTVPVLWDKKRATIVSNESAEIMRMFNDGFGTLANSVFDLYPVDLRAAIDEINEWIYPTFNNGVYRAGFAATQYAYDEAVAEVFSTLEALEARLASGGPFLFGERCTEADIRLFVTLVRFDVAYYSLFKCNLRHLTDYGHVSEYLQRVLDIPGVRSTVCFDHIKRGYHSIKAVNPTGIVSIGPAALPDN